jgi:hypothetical protein
MSGYWPDLRAGCYPAAIRLVRHRESVPRRTGSPAAGSAKLTDIQLEHALADCCLR